MGLKLSKVRRGLRYKKEAFLKPFIEFNIQKRKEAQEKGDKFRKEFYKLANNSVYTKSFENVRERCNVHIVGGVRKRVCFTFLGNPTFKGLTSSQILRWLWFE